MGSKIRKIGSRTQKMVLHIVKRYSFLLLSVFTLFKTIFSVLDPIFLIFEPIKYHYFDPYFSKFGFEEDI